MRVDVEHVGRPDSSFETAVFTSDERELVSSLDDSARREWLLRLWCAKEALGKALGHGLTPGVHALPAKAAALDRGDVTVEGPFRAVDDVEGGPREAILQGVRLEVGQQAAESGADAVMVRELVYERDAATAEASSPEIIAVAGMLVSFVDPVCVPE